MDDQRARPGLRLPGPETTLDLPRLRRRRAGSSSPARRFGPRAARRPRRLDGRSRAPRRPRRSAAPRRCLGSSPSASCRRRSPRPARPPFLVGTRLGPPATSTGNERAGGQHRLRRPTGDITAVVAAARDSVVTITADGLYLEPLLALPGADDRRRLGRDPDLERATSSRTATSSTTARASPWPSPTAASCPRRSSRSPTHHGPRPHQGRGERPPRRDRSATPAPSRSARRPSRSAARSAATPRPSPAASSPASTARSRSPTRRRASRPRSAA